MRPPLLIKRKQIKNKNIRMGPWSPSEPAEPIQGVAAGSNNSSPPAAGSALVCHLRTLAPHRLAPLHARSNRRRRAHAMEERGRRAPTVLAPRLGRSVVSSRSRTAHRCRGLLLSGERGGRRRGGDHERAGRGWRMRGGEEREGRPHAERGDK